MAVRGRQWADYDIYWHLANGRLMVEGGAFPSPDRFSWSAAGTTVTSHSAQVDRLFYLFWEVGGARGVGFLAALGYGLALLPFALLAARLLARPIVEAAVLLLTVFALGPYMGARPHALGVAIFGLIVYLLERPFGRRGAVVVGVGLGIWANVHGSFQIGFGLVGAAVVAWLWARDRRSAAHAGLALGVGFALSLLSPYGIRLWAYPLEEVSYPLFRAVNPDWFSLRPLAPQNIAMSLLLLAAVGVGIWRASDARSVAAMGLVLPVIQVARFTPFLAPLLGFLVLERLLERVPALRVAPGSRRHAMLTAPKTSAVAWSLLVGGGLLMAVAGPSSMEGAAFGPLPERAVDRLLACGEPAAVWNDYNWGGYLIWRGEARYSVGMDGRAITVYSHDTLDDYYKVAAGSAGWQDIVQSSPARYALTQRGAAAEIDALPGWRRVYRDETATLAVRDGAAWRC